MYLIGNGLISSSFKNYDLGEVVVFASGVSNSKETKESEYEREIKLLLNCLNKYKLKIIYFSTLSVFSETHTKYIEHKLRIEEIIKKNSKDYLILRLPNVIGESTNKNQLLPFFCEKIKNGEELIIGENIIRDLIDVNDLPKICKIILRKNITGIINVSFNNYIKVEDIIKILNEIYFNNKSTIRFKKDFNNYDYDNNEFLKLIENSNEKFSKNPKDIIYKYLKK